MSLVRTLSLSFPPFGSLLNPDGASFGVGSDTKRSFDAFDLHGLGRSLSAGTLPSPEILPRPAPLEIPNEHQGGGVERLRLTFCRDSCVLPATVAYPVSFGLFRIFPLLILTNVSILTSTNLLI